MPITHTRIRCSERKADEGAVEIDADQMPQTTAATAEWESYARRIRRPEQRLMAHLRSRHLMNRADADRHHRQERKSDQVAQRRQPVPAIGNRAPSPGRAAADRVLSRSFSSATSSLEVFRDDLIALGLQREGAKRDRREITARCRTDRRQKAGVSGIVFFSSPSAKAD